MAKSSKGRKSRPMNSRNTNNCGPEKDIRGRRGSKYVNREEREDFSKDRVSSSLNDISWYSRNPNLLAAAGSFPYPYRPGMQTPLTSITGQTGSAQGVIPGILTINWVPSFGKSSAATDPASIAGKEFYGRVRSAFSGSLDADAPDYIMYVGALDSLFAYIGYLKRLYRTLTTYTPENYNLPDAVLRAMYIRSPVDQNKLRSDKVKLWQGINELILKSRKFKCPAVMDLFNRHYWMSDHLYADAATPNSQFYLFNLMGVWKYTPLPEGTSTNNAAGLQMTLLPQFGTGGITVDDFVAFGNGLIEALDAWDDSYTISGYLGRAFEGTPSFTVAELLQDELLTAEFVPEVLSQIENSRCITPPGLGGRELITPISTLQVRQSVLENAVLSNPKIELTLSDLEISNYNAFVNNVGVISPMISIRSDAPSVADTVIASRLQAVAQYNLNATTKKLTIDIIAGTEIPVFMFYTVVGQITGNIYDLGNYQTVSNKSMNVTTVNSSAFMIGMGQFDWHPFCYVLLLFVNDSNKSFYNLAVNGDIHNPSFPSVGDMANLHKICLYSELNSFQIQ